MANANVNQSRAFRPPKAYRPKTDGDFIQYVPHLEHYFTLLNIYLLHQTTMLLYNLGEEAFFTAFHLGLTDATGYDEAKTALMQCSPQVETLKELRTKIHRRFQSSDDSLEHYAMELRVLSSKAYPTIDRNVLEKMAKLQFILKIRNSITREKLIVNRPEKL